MKKTIITVTAICLVAVLLCSAACLGTVMYVKQQRAEMESASVSVSAAPTALPADSVLFERVASSALTPNQIYQIACKQVVGISTEIVGYNMFGQQTSNAVSGTGFVISEDGYILTNNHVIEDAFKGGYTVTVKFYDGSSYEAEIVGVEDDNDIAVLKIDATGLNPVVIGNSDEMLVGESLYVVGNPLGELTYTMTSGIVSALDRSIATSANVSVNMFQLDAAVNSGNSGGPVYNAKGEVIGVVTAKYKDTGVEGLGFAIPINDAVEIASQLIDFGYVTGKAYLGITATTITQSEASRYNMVPGVYVYSIEDGGCAANAGIKQGDVITKVNDTEVKTMEDLSAAKKDFKAGDTCDITVFRTGEYLTFTVTFDEEPPAEPGAAATPTPAPSQGTSPFGNGGSTETFPTNPDEGSGSGSMWDWMEEFFNQFSSMFGGEAEEEQDADGGFRHFG